MSETPLEKAVAKSPDMARVIERRAKAIPPWVYEQKTGFLFHYDNGDHVGTGYSGAPNSVNDGSKEHLKGIGPIPKGLYAIGHPRGSEKTGRFVMDLTPLGHMALGRSGLQIHGDNREGNRTASSGCIVLGPKERSEIANGSPLLQVI